MLKPFIRTYLAITLLVTTVTFVLWLLRDALTLANFSLAYLLIVLVSAIYQGIRPSLYAALLSFLCFNYFLVRPLYTFHVADPREGLNLIAFFAAAILTGRLAHVARQQTEDARQRAAEQNMLYELTSVLNQLTDSARIHQSIKAVLHKHFTICQIDILPRDVESAPQVANVLYLPLRAGDSVYGTLRLTFDQPPPLSLQRLLAACSVQAAMALQRVELAQRAQQSKSFEEADRLKTALLRAVSHDLRTPITIIKTSASNLLNLHTTLAEDERIDMLKVIESEADHLDKMVGNLLDISRLKAGAMTINLAWNSLEEVAGEVAARVWQRIHEERITINFPDDMPMAQFDYGLILQTLANLVDNALRYEPEGTRIEIRGSAQADDVRVAIVNHGPTIPPEERALIMEPFYHGAGGRTGLGLAIAKGIIEAHQGQLWVEDTPGGGATFVFTLPLDVMPGSAS
ncbi:MAG: DUF4118 domain-containing protein [Anaerolineae bacterium]|nr:DUF4118 domain-containing protein [Anaerolineae bacterium]